jgi:hypothetical protein
MGKVSSLNINQNVEDARDCRRREGAVLIPVTATKQGTNWYAFDIGGDVIVYCSYPVLNLILSCRLA